MVLHAKTRLYKLSGRKYAIYLPKELTDDSQFPFDLEAAREKGALEIFIMASKIEGLGKLLVKPSEKETTQHVQRGNTERHS